MARFLIDANLPYRFRLWQGPDYVHVFDLNDIWFLERRGFKVIRFWNHEVLAQTDRMREAIRERIEELMGSPTP